MPRPVPFRPSQPVTLPETPPRTAPVMGSAKTPAKDHSTHPITHRDPCPSSRALRTEWLSGDAPPPATAFEALMDWVEGRA